MYAIVVIFTFLTANVCATKILLFPANVNSHVSYFSRLGVDLAKLGNVVTVIVPSNAGVPDFLTDNIENFTYLKYPVDPATSISSLPETSKAIVNMAMTASHIQKMMIMGEYHEKVLLEAAHDCMRLLDNTQIMCHIRETGYEFAISDMVGAIACYNTIPYSLGIPYATLSVSIASQYLFRVPRFATFPNVFSAGDRQTFPERLTAFILDRIIVSILPDTKHYMKKNMSKIVLT